MGIRLLIAVILAFAPAALAAPAKMVEVIVELDGPRLPGGQSRAALMKLLKQHLGQAQGKLTVKATEGFWSSQSFLVRLPESQVGRLVQLPQVRRVYPNRTVKLARAVALSQPTSSGSNWALGRIGAPQVWAAGLRGQGIRIGHLDTGVDASHPALQGKIAAFAAISDDGTPRASNPFDTAQHGTYTAGLLVGNGVGVAPDARLVSAMVLPDGYGTLAQVLGGLDWVLEQNVQIVSMSLGLEGNWSEFAPVVARMKQMGVLPVFAIGNTGGTTSSPGNMPDVLGIGTVDQNNALAGFSSRGEVRWGAPYNVSITKPDLVAPGVDVVSSVPGGKYMAMSGTSTSTAVAAGSAALLMSGGAKADQVRQALLTTAQPLQAGTGRGALRLDAALAALRPTPPPPAQQPQPQPQPPQASPPPADSKAALLVIETDGAEATTNAIKNLGFQPEVMRVKADSRPKADRIDDFPLVVWVVPGNWTENWPDEQRKALRAYVEAGGRLMILAQVDKQAPVVENSAYGKGKAAFVSGDVGALPLDRRTQVLQKVLGDLVK